MLLTAASHTNAENRPVPISIGLAGLPLTLTDAVAVAWFLLAFGGYQTASRWPMVERRSIAGAVQRQRVAWMRNMARRENRMSDSMLMQQLGQGNAFFTSTAAIAIGGLVTLLGTGDKVQVLLERLPFVAKSDAAVFDLKLLLLIAIFVYGFFKFAWAFRLSHYTGIMIGATPPATGNNEAECESHALAVSKLIGIAADHANSGLRSFYYAFAAMAWIFHPALFIIATTWVVVILIRRDFFSRSRRVLAGESADR